MDDDIFIITQNNLPLVFIYYLFFYLSTKLWIYLTLYLSIRLIYLHMDGYSSFSTEIDLPLVCIYLLSNQFSFYQTLYLSAYKIYTWVRYRCPFVCCTHRCLSSLLSIHKSINQTICLSFSPNNLYLSIAVHPFAVDMDGNGSISTQIN